MPAVASPSPRRIARAFLPSRYHYFYAHGKLASDSIYGGVIDALGDARAPLLDLGCGIGLLAHYCAAHGRPLDYHGLDNDAGKIAIARVSVARAGLATARFSVCDLAREDLDDVLAAHRGSVTILDLLQYLPAEVQAQLLKRSAACLIPGARLVVRTGLADGGWRARVTRAADVFARVLRWMNTAPLRYPTRDGLAAQLDALGLRAEFRPLWGRTPFNNWLVIAERR